MADGTGGGYKKIIHGDGGSSDVKGVRSGGRGSNDGGSGGFVPAVSGLVLSSSSTLSHDDSTVSSLEYRRGDSAEGRVAGVSRDAGGRVSNGERADTGCREDTADVPSISRPSGWLARCAQGTKTAVGVPSTCRPVRSHTRVDWGRSAD